MPEPVSSPPPPKRRSWLRWIAVIAGTLVLLLVIAYFIITSNAFLKSVILPKAGQSLNARITAGSASIHPFSEVVLRNVTIETSGPQPLVTAGELRLRYHLTSFLNGKNEVEELALLAPFLYVVVETNGASNLDPILQALHKPKKEKKPPQPEKPTQLDVRNVSLQNGRITYVQKKSGNASQSIQLQNARLSLDHLQNGQSGKLALSSDFQFQSAPGAKSTNSAALLAGKINGDFDFTLGTQLEPLSAKGETVLALNQAAGAYQDYANYRATLSVNLTPTEIRQLALRFARQENALGEIDVSGPFHFVPGHALLEALSAQLHVEIKSIDRQILNLIGAARGWDFAESTFNSTNLITLSSNASLVAVSGQLLGRQISIRQHSESTPLLNLDLGYDVTVDLQKKNALLRQLHLLGRKNQNDLLRVRLDKPMSLSWGQGAPGFEQSSLDFTITGLNLADWKMILGTNAPTGVVTAQLRLLAQQNGKVLQTDLSGQIENLNLSLGTNRVERANLQFQAGGQVEDLQRINLPKFQVTWQQQQRQNVLQVSGSARADLAKKETSLQATIDGQLRAIAQQLPITNLAAENGVVHLEASLHQQGEHQAAAGQMQFSDFTGRYGPYAFRKLTAQAAFDVEEEKQEISIAKANLNLQQDGRAGGQLALSGKYNTSSKAGQFTFKADQINEAALGPFLAPSLHDKNLVSITFNGSGQATLNPAAESALKADLSVTNLVVQDPAHPGLHTPLGAALQLDGSMKEKWIELRQCLVSLAPTAHSANNLQLQAKLDLSTNQPSPSQITVQSQSFDVTPYYDLFAGRKETNAAAPPPPASTPSGQEPEAIPLPIQNLTADIKIDRFILRELDASNLVANAKVDHDQITLDPVKMRLNGAPVQLAAKVNVGVRGYQYDLLFSSDHAPLAPLVDSFSTSSNRLEGNLVAQGHILGAGTTGKSLRESLQGQVQLSLTNLNLQILGPKVRRLLEPIALILRVPELTQTPINWVNSQVNVGNGQIDLKDFSVLSAAFFARSQGTIPIEPGLTNSPLNLPVEFSLRRSLAQKVNLIPATAPTNTPYVQLPTFVRLAGTLGDPKTKINEVVISGLLLRSAGGIPRIGGKAGNVLENLGGVLSGRQSGSATKAPRGTNSPLNPLDLFKNLPRGRATNPPASQTNSPALNPLDLFKLIPKK